jgi:ABC-type glycerol-3-phosphate transport system permease component
MRRAHLLDLAWYVGMGLFLFVFLSPLIWVYLASVTPSNELASSWTGVFDVRHYTLDAFSRVWNGFGFSQAFANSTLVSASVAVCTVALCSLPAYALSRYTFRGRTSLAMAILLGQLVPGIVVVIPIVVLLRNIHLTDSLIGLAGVYTVSDIPLGVWLLRGFLDAIPRELDEAALVDGGGLLTILRHVILPLALPGIITVGAFTFMTAWGEYLFALSLITSNQNWTLPLALQEAFGRNGLDLGVLTAGGVIASLPVAIMFMFVQRSLVSGLVAGGVKG